MKLYLPDTNIFIYAFYGEEPFAKELFVWIADKTLLISSIAAAEFLSGGDENQRNRFQALIDKLGTVPVDTTVARIAAEYKRQFALKKPRLRLPDALIAATCKLYGAALVSENLEDFPMKDIEKLKLQ